MKRPRGSLVSSASRSLAASAHALAIHRFRPRALAAGLGFAFLALTVGSASTNAGERNPAYAGEAPSGIVAALPSPATRIIVPNVAADSNSARGDPNIWLQVQITVLFRDVIMKVRGSDPIFFRAKFLVPWDLESRTAMLWPGKIVHFEPHPEDVPACYWTREYSRNATTIILRPNNHNTDLLLSVDGPSWTEVQTCPTEKGPVIIRYPYTHEWMLRGLWKEFGERSGNDEYLRIPLRYEPSVMPLEDPKPFGVPPGCAILGHASFPEFHEADQDAWIGLKVAVFDKKNEKCAEVVIE